MLKLRLRRPARMNVSWLRRVSWWPMLLGPLGVAAVVVASRTYGRFNMLDHELDKIGPYLLIVPVAIYAIRSAVTFNPLFVVLTFLTASLLCREIHFSGMDKIIYGCMAVTGAWMVLWRRRLIRPLTDWRHTSWLICTMATYVLSQVIARRAFRFVPGEDPIHSKIEEGVETMAHLMLIITSLVASWRNYKKRK